MAESLFFSKAAVLDDIDRHVKPIFADRDKAYATTVSILIKHFSKSIDGLAAAHEARIRSLENAIESMSTSFGKQ